MLDTLFKSLEDKGLQLSEPSEIKLPQVQSPKQSFYNAILTSKKKNIVDQQTPKFVILNVGNQYFLVGRANTLVLYRYTINANAKPVVNCLDTQHLYETVKSIHSCPLKYALDQPTIPIAVQHDLNIQFLYIDIKTQKLIIKNDIKCPVKPKAINFISDRQILMLTEKYQLHYFLIDSLYKLIQQEKKNACIDVSPKEVLINATFLGIINQQQDSIIKLFFVTEDSDGLERLKVKEYTRTIDNTIQIMKQDFLIGTVPGTQKKILSAMNIIQAGQFFLARSLHQIIVIKKKYNKYLFMDNVSQKTYHGSNLILSKQGLICSLGKDTFELSFVKLADPKCHSRMLDSIEVKDSSLTDRFQKVWTFNNQKETWIMMLFEKQGHLQAFSIDKLQPMTKLLQKVKVSSKEDLNIIQELAENLGIRKKDFYLKVWMHSKKQLSNIHDYLLPCDDIQSIKKQLKSWLRRKKMKVCQMLKVLEKVSMMIEIQLKTDLGYDLLKQYVKNEFLRKKVKLYGMNQDIDHRDFQKIYESSIMDMFVQIVNADLFPKPQEVDPLHALAPKPKEEQKNIKHVMQEFKIVLLQNYSEFLIDFLRNYEKDILKVLQSYYFILPKHPYSLQVKMVSEDEALALEGSFVNENPNNSTIITASIIGMVGTQQPAWFSTIMPKSWNRQLTRDKLQKSLHDHYSTSHILSVINSLSESNYGKQAKLQRHGLVNYTHAEYKKRVEKMNGTRLYLRVCQFANECALKNNIQTATPKLVQLFKEKLKLDGVEYEQCRLYCNMHYFMLKHNIFEGKKITVQGLIELGKKPENLVAIFFLGNRQKKQYILNQFRSLYQTPKQFNFVLEKFIFSQNCSRIQLEILLKQVKNLVPEFQSDNQELIDLIIRGFCKKLELRQQNSTEHFLSLIQQLHLKKTLALKVNQIVQLKESADIFHHFNWSRKSYDEIIMDSRTTMIKLLESYFNQQMQSMDITIEYQYFSLEFPRNMLNVLLYLKENVFYDIDEKHVLMIYGEMLIQWKQFDVVKGLIHDENIPDKLGFAGREYIEQLMLTSLDIIYNDQSIIYDQQTKNQIKNIIDIDVEEDSPFRVREQAKLAIVDIFEGWGCTVRPHDIYLVTTQWKEMNRNQFIEDLITEYIDNIDFNVLIQIYQLLEMTDKETKNIKTQNQEFAIFCLYYCECLRDMGRFKDVMEVMGFMKNIVQFNVHIPYELQSETFLQVVCANYGDDLNAGKKYIDFYYEKEGHDREMQKIFQCYLAPEEIELFRPINYIFVDKVHYFKRAQSIDISISGELLWSISSEGEQLTNQQIYYNYFYLLMMTKYPDLVISRMNKISYNHDKIMNAVMRLQACIDEKSELLGWNVYEIYKRMLKGLYLEAIHRIPNIKAELSQKEEEPEKSKLQIIKNLLKADREKNTDLLKVIGKCEAHLENVRTTQRHIRQKKYIDRQKKIEEQRKKIPEIAEPEEDEQPQQLNVTIKFADLKQRKRQITSRSAFITQRDIIDQVYDDLNQSRFAGGRKNNGPKFSLVNNLFLHSLNSQKKQSEEVQSIVDLINNEQYDKVRDFSQESITEAAKAVFYDQTTSIYEASNKLEYLDLIDPNKLKMCRLFNIFKKQISDSDLKSIFTFEFLTRPLQAGEGQQHDAIFNELEQNLTIIIQNKRAEEAKSIAVFIGNVLEDNTIYQKKTIALALESVGNCGFSPDNLLKIREYVSTLGEDMEFFAQCIPRIMKVFRKNPQLNGVLRENVLGLKDLTPEIQSLF